MSGLPRLLGEPTFNDDSWQAEAGRGSPGKRPLPDPRRSVCPEAVASDRAERCDIGRIREEFVVRGSLTNALRTQHTADEKTRGGEVVGLNPNVRVYRYSKNQFFDCHCMWNRLISYFPHRELVRHPSILSPCGHRFDRAAVIPFMFRNLTSCRYPTNPSHATPEWLGGLNAHCFPCNLPYSPSTSPTLHPARDVVICLGGFVHVVFTLT